jgi:hypothetical protein
MAVYFTCFGKSCYEFLILQTRIGDSISFSHAGLHVRKARFNQNNESEDNPFDHESVENKKDGVNIRVKLVSTDCYRHLQDNYSIKASTNKGRSQKKVRATFVYHQEVYTYQCG